VNQPVSSVPTALASLTKGGLNAFTKELAIEFAKTVVRVNAVSPGIIVSAVVRRGERGHYSHTALVSSFVKAESPLRPGRRVVIS
ncbi:SDR family oxidoreductase, partial [Rhizobium ruizarguesonis]